MSLLMQLTDVKAGYGDIRILHGIDLDVPRGEITALVGANGAGKSTFFRTLAGLLPLHGGSVYFNDERIDAIPSHQRVEKGIVLVPEGRLVFPEMSVLDNLRLGAINPRARLSLAESLDNVYGLFPRLNERRTQHAGTLSGGEQQMLAIARGLMARPELLLLDEPTLGLAPGMATQVFKIIPQLISLGVTVVIAEQDVHRTLQIATRCHVLSNGKITLSGTGEQFINSDAVTHAFLGIA